PGVHAAIVSAADSSRRERLAVLVELNVALFLFILLFDFFFACSFRRPCWCENGHHDCFARDARSRRCQRGTSCSRHTRTLSWFGSAKPLLLSSRGRRGVSCNAS